VTKLLQHLHDELVRRHYATTTRESYLKILKAFQRRIGKRLDRVSPDDLRRYQVYLLEERRLAVGTRPTCSKPGPTCARFKCCSGTPISRIRRSISISRGATCKRRRIRSSNCRCRRP
jgi:hypothetical protein